LTTTAESRGLAEEQAALRRLATLVAGGAPSEKVFAAATEEVGRLLPVDYASMSRFESGRTLACVAAWSRTGRPCPPVGTRVSIGGNNVSSLVFETRRPARIDSYADASGPLADAIREEGVRSAVGAPIIVDGRVWGAIGVGSVMELPLPEDTEARLASLTELLATAIANAESRVGLAQLAEEQAALRRVATLVAQGVPPDELFAAVTEEVVRVLPVQLARMGRYEPDGTVTFVAAAGMTDAFLPAGARLELGGKNVSTLVAQAGRPARIDGYADASGPIGVTIREAGIRSAVGTPITVEDSLWGVMAVASTVEQRLPADTEARLAQFTELLAMAIANAESRAGLARLAEEQAALRRVATLVAEGVAPEALFAAAAEEVGQLLPVEYTHLGRYESDDTLTFVAVWSAADPLVAVGSRIGLGGKNLATMVFETCRPARIDSFADASGSIGALGRERGVRSAVGTPIIVAGRLWGAMSAGSIKQPLPGDAEERVAEFTDLLATAIANAESRAGLARLGEEQAALRRVATLVAQGVPPDELFAAVAEEVGNVLPVQGARIGRYEPDGTVTFLATTVEPGAAAAAAARAMLGEKNLALGGKNLATVVFETGRPACLDFDDASGPVAAGIRGIGGGSAVGSPIVVDGRLWGVATAGSTLERPLPPDAEARLTDFTELLATAIANAESRADLAASRARIVAAADETRRRIERDLHDGAQQRLVHTVIVQQLALRALENGDENLGDLMAEALRHAEQANAELSELAHGVLPSVLTREGLPAALNALVSRVSLPVRVDVSVKRLPARIETTAYFVVSEALTNVVKHARASGATVTASVERGQLRVEIRDDGNGGAHGGGSSGLRGLDDRVSALGGRLVVESAAAQGTVVRAFLPVPDRG
jgi:GAF domain-containing protein